MDMQPNRNMAVENQLQAVQLGASLYDRAQTQKRMMEQFQLQSAEFLIQKQGMELQNKIRENALATTIKEQKAEVDEFDDFSKFIGETGAYLDNPTASAKFPVMPAFKAPRYRLEANKILDNFEKYSARAELVASKRRAEAKADAMTAAQYNIAARYGAFKLNTQTGQQEIDYELVNKIASKEREAALAQSTAKTGSLTGNLEISRGKLKALIDNNASDANIARAKLEYEYEKNLAIQQLKQNEFGLKVKTQEDKSAINQQNLEISRGKLKALIDNNASDADIARARLAVDKSFKEARVKLDEEELGFKKEFKTKELGIEGEKVDILRSRAETEREKVNKTVGLKPTKLDLDELEFSEAVLNGIKPLEPYLNQDLYGPTFNVRVKAGEMSGAFGTEREANQVYNNLRSGALFKRGGKALTKSEIGVITSNIGNPTDSGFPDRVNTYKLLQARTLKDRIDKLRTQGISNNPQYSGYIADLEKKANEVLGVEEEVAAPTGQGPKRVKQGGKIYELNETTNAYVEVVQ